MTDIDPDNDKLGHDILVKLHFKYSPKCLLLIATTGSHNYRRPVQGAPCLLLNDHWR